MSSKEDHTKCVDVGVAVRELQRRMLVSAATYHRDAQTAATAAYNAVPNYAVWGSEEMENLWNCCEAAYDAEQALNHHDSRVRGLHYEK